MRNNGDLVREDDPRYKRSRRLLREAIVQLSHEDLDKVTVSAVCELTGVDRATFYRHVPDIEHLTADTLGALADDAASAWDLSSDGSGAQAELSGKILAQYLSHVEANWALYKWALGPTGSAAAMHVVLDRVTSAVEAELRRQPTSAGAPGSPPVRSSVPSSAGCPRRIPSRPRNSRPGSTPS